MTPFLWQRGEFLSQGPLRTRLSVDEHDSLWTLANPADETQQVRWVNMGRVAGEAVYPCLHRQRLTTDRDPLLPRLQGSPGRALGLITDEYDIGSAVAEQCLQIVDHQYTCHCRL